MAWLAQNWIWLALVVGAVFLMRRLGGCGMDHSGHRAGRDDAPAHRHGSDGGTTSVPLAQGAQGTPVAGSRDDKPRSEHRGHGCH